MASSKVMASSKPRNSDLSSPTSTSTTTTTTPSRSRPASSATTPSTSKPATTSTNYSSSSSFLSDQAKAQNNNILFSSPSPASTMTVDGILRNVYATPSAESTLLDAQITLIDYPMEPVENFQAGGNDQEITDILPAPTPRKTVDEVWREIVSGRKEMKEEPDELMTLEDFLANAAEVEGSGGGADEDEVKIPPPERLSGGVYAFDPVPSTFQELDKMEGSIVGFGNGVDVAIGGGGRGKRGRAALMEPLDKAAQQRQKRMIKNRESAARSRERKQAYQVELESLAMRLEEENERLLKEKEERTKERYKQLMEKVVPVVEKRKPPRVLRRVRSFEW